MDLDGMVTMTCVRLGRRWPAPAVLRTAMWWVLAAAVTATAVVGIVAAGLALGAALA